jgi:hypothetical protein
LAEPQIVNTLRSKRNELERIIASYEKATEAARRDLAHVNATLQLFEREGVPNAYPSRMNLIRVFRRGEIFAICKAALWQAPIGMDTRELALAVLTAKGVDIQDASCKYEYNSQPHVTVRTCVLDHNILLLQLSNNKGIR